MHAPPDALAFTPIPSASFRHDGWTPARQHDFIAALTRLGLVGAAARSVGISPKSAYALLKRAGAESGFALAWAAAVDQGRARALNLGIERAVNGVARPLFYRGLQVAEVRHYDSRLLLAALRAVTGRTAAGEAAAPAAPLRRGLWRFTNTPGAATLHGRALRELPVGPVTSETVCLSPPRPPRPRTGSRAT